MILTGRNVAVIASVLFIVATSFAYYANILPVFHAAPLNVSGECQRPPGYSLIILDSQGFNNSLSHDAPSTPWPLLEVQKGQTVNILVCNLDKVQTHGFAVDNYLDRGIALGPGQVNKISFVADRVGEFRIYCDVFCSVHNPMLGKLKVS